MSDGYRHHGAFLIYHQGEGAIGYGAVLPEGWTYVKWVGGNNIPERIRRMDLLTRKLTDLFGDSYWIQWEGE